MFAAFFFGLAACSEPDSTVSMVIGRSSFEPEGYDGLEVEWTVGASTRVFHSTDFVQDAYNMSPHVRFGTADRGIAVLTLRLREEDALIAEGSLEIELAPGRAWVFGFFRGVEDVPPPCDGQCNDDPVSIPVKPEAARQPGDVLWILWGVASQPASVGL